MIFYIDPVVKIGTSSNTNFIQKKTENFTTFLYRKRVLIMFAFLLLHDKRTLMSYCPVLDGVEFSACAVQFSEIRILRVVF